MQMSGCQRDFKLNFINEKPHSKRTQRENVSKAESKSSLKRVKFDLAIQQTVEGDFDEKGFC